MTGGYCFFYIYVGWKKKVLSKMFGCPLRDFINATETKEADYQMEKRKITIYYIIYKWPEDTK